MARWPSHPAPFDGGSIVRPRSIHEPAPKPATFLRWGTGAVARRTQEASGQGAEQLEGRGTVTGTLSPPGSSWLG